ncbi:Putative outer membrane protein [Arcticibacter svalbardensis MN12-7]|uniref:Putative outer membrane protein n=1 Tax=Arcticibacter svalbardensis MN12-7 TaxID=1150600 RepID=R9GLG6_9SPHI|nr:RagB/SusD family nutrient uptake outer membrane protein [Arcticibacter svalbardensis]EOR92546.1 Putative outer membrane protein [Arcticibacter svalbardensis MN12-7]
MKKIYLILIVIITGTAGCKKDFLETTKNDGYTSANFWKTSNDAIAGVNGIYQDLTNSALYGGSMPMLLENLTPNAGSNANVNQVQTISQGLASPLTNAIFATRWAANYKGIGRANDLLANIDNITMDATLKARIKGEAQFLRALYYFDLLNFYGGVPIILDKAKPEDQQLPRNTHDEVQAVILSDLDAASPVLPLSYSGADVGRVTQGAALALKARVYLFSGQWQKAADAAKAVMDLKKYTLFANYRNLFSLANENNSEVIFDVQFKNDAKAQKTSYDISLERYDYESPSLDLVNDYYMKDGFPITTSALYDPQNSYTNRDPRFAQTIAYPNSTFAGRVVTTTQYPSTGATVKKYTIYDEAKPTAYLIDGQSEINYQIIRYADILLMYAEAINELGQMTQTIADASINLVRLRAGMPKVIYQSQLQMQPLIRHERRIEFFGEGTYVFDIKRWKTAETVMNAPVKSLTGVIIYQHAFNPSRDYLWPIPATVLEYSPQLEQNPKY